MASLKNPHLQPQGCTPGCSFGGLLLIPRTPRTPSPRPQTRWMGDEAALALAGRFTVLPEKACPGPLQSRTALEAGTINPAHYFLRASHPINNSFGW